MRLFRESAICGEVWEQVVRVVVVLPNETHFSCSRMLGWGISATVLFAGWRNGSAGGFGPPGSGSIPDPAASSLKIWG